MMDFVLFFYGTRGVIYDAYIKEDCCLFEVRYFECRKNRFGF